MVEDKKLPKSLTDVAAALPDAPPEEFPRAFGNYMLLAPLARGGMGEVFLAKHGSVRGLEKHCVVKTLRPHLTDDREYTTRFIDEARIVVQLGHRNICHVFDVGTVGERYYLAMEYIAGRDLRALTHDVGAISVGGAGGVVHPGLALHIVCEVLEALDYAHRHSDAATGKPLLLVHRDVSPQNVMLSWEGEVKLIDFGLAASTLKMEQTSPNVVMGKLAYMAPEQVRGERVDGRADMFAVGVMLYEILVGERFYEGRSPYEIWGLAAQGGFRPRRWDALDEEMRDILDKALAGNLAQRYDGCLALREALQKYRFARGLHGDGPMLRALMQQVYAKDIDDSRKRLVELTQMSPKDPLAVRSSGVFSVSTEPTLSIARSPSSSMPVKEATEPTEMAVKAMFGPRRVPVFVASLIAAAVVLAVVGVAWVIRTTSASTTTTNAHSLDAGAAPVVVADAKVPEAPKNDAPKLDALNVDPPKSDAPKIDAPKSDEPRKTDAKPKVDAPKVDAPKVDAPKVDAPKVDAPKSDDVKSDPPKIDEPKADAPKSDDAKPVEIRSWGQWIDDIGKKCPTLPCYTEAMKHRYDFGKIVTNHELFSSWATGVKKCMAECGVQK